MKNTTMKKVGIWCLAIGLFMVHLLCRTTAHAGENHWQQFPSANGECEIAFPSQPSFMEQSLQLPEGKGVLHYEVYLAPFDDRKGVFMLLIATYPSAVNSGNEIAGLEGLVRGIVNHHPENKLVFANLLEFSEYPALTFLVQSSANYFRGQAVMIDNKLYLIAMEGKKGEMNEKTFNHFLQSFRLADQNP